MFTPCQENAHQVRSDKETPAALLAVREGGCGILTGVSGGGGQGVDRKSWSVGSVLSFALLWVARSPLRVLAGLIIRNLNLNPAGFLASLSLSFHICKMAIMINTSLGCW